MDRSYLLLILPFPLHLTETVVAIRNAPICTWGSRAFIDRLLWCADCGTENHKGAGAIWIARRAVAVYLAELAIERIWPRNELVLSGKNWMDVLIHRGCADESGGSADEGKEACEFNHFESCSRNVALNFMLPSWSSNKLKVKYLWGDWICFNWWSSECSW